MCCCRWRLAIALVGKSQVPEDFSVGLLDDLDVPLGCCKYPRCFEDVFQTYSLHINVHQCSSDLDAKLILSEAVMESYEII
jgi:hypothetical protein